MKLVLDSNILFSMLIKPGRPLNLVLLKDLEIFSPSFVWEEYAKYKDEIALKSQLSPRDFEGLLQLFKNRVIFISEDVLVPYRAKAEMICPDPNDTLFFATALYLNCALWSNEKKLKNQDVIKVYATHELMQAFIDVLPTFP